jgi:hypothetical protein
MADILKDKIKPDKGPWEPVHAWRGWIDGSIERTTILLWYNETRHNYRYENLPINKAWFLIYILRNVRSLYIDPTNGKLEVSAEPLGPI